MSEKTVYLAGPITGLTYEGCTSWRDYAREQLEYEMTGRADINRAMPPENSLVPEYRRTGIKTLNPMRMKEHLDDGREIPAVSPDYDDQFVVERDLYDIRQSNVVLENLLGAERVSVGSMQEMGYGKALSKYIVVLIEPDGVIESPQDEGPLQSSGRYNPHHHLFVYHNASVVLHNLDDAIEVIKAL